MAAKFAELISGLTINGAKASKTGVAKKLAYQYDKANQPVEGKVLSKAEIKAIEAGFAKNAERAKERAQTRAKERAEARKEKEATKK